MHIVTAHQNVSSSEQLIARKSRLEVPRATVTPGAANPAQPTTANNGRADFMPTTTAVPDTESTSSNEQNEDSQQFNALLSVGAVKRILEQLTSGKLLSWIEGTDLEKINAQKTQQQEASPPLTFQGATPTNTPNASTNNGNTIFELSYRYQQVSANFSGAVELADGRAFSWSFDLQMQSEQLSMSISQTEPAKDPLVLSFDQTPFRYTGETHSFDFFANGETKQLAGLAASQYYLTFDRNQNQQIDNGSELFGPTTNQGYQELALLDDDQNGFIDENDASWSKLGVWQPGEQLKSLSQMGVVAISTMSVSTSFGLYDSDKLQAHIARSGIFLKESGEVGLVQQVDLNV